ncbi:MAG: hypothetical protein PVH61_31735 [Candidatus Aminicenantes bacterium]|jgi:hypothetical protein
MNFLRRKDEEPDAVTEYAEGEMVAEEGRSTVRETLENADIPLLQYATHDANWLVTFYTDPDLQPFKPTLTQLLRLTKVNDKEKMAFQDEIELAYTLLTMYMPEAEMSSPRGVKIKLAATTLKLLINDSHKGFKLDILTRIRKELTLMRQKEQKQGILG